MGGLSRGLGVPVVRAREVLRAAGALGDRSCMVPAHLHCSKPPIWLGVRGGLNGTQHMQPASAEVTGQAWAPSRRAHVVEGSQAAISTAGYQHRHACALSSDVGAGRLHACCQPLRKQLPAVAEQAALRRRCRAGVPGGGRGGRLAPYVR